MISLGCLGSLEPVVTVVPQAKKGQQNSLHRKDSNGTAKNYYKVSNQQNIVNKPRYSTDLTGKRACNNVYNAFHRSYSN